MSWLTKLAASDLDKLITARLSRLNGSPFAKSDDLELFCTFREINGFYFMVIGIVGPFNIRTTNGCEATFSGSFGSVNVESDTMEIDTDYSNALNIGLTTFDLDLEDETIEHIKANAVDAISFRFKKQTLDFTVTDKELLAAAWERAIEAPEESEGAEEAEEAVENPENQES